MSLIWRKIKLKIVLKIEFQKSNCRFIHLHNHSLKIYSIWKKLRKNVYLRNRNEKELLKQFKSKNEFKNKMNRIRLMKLFSKSIIIFIDLKVQSNYILQSLIEIIWKSKMIWRHGFTKINIGTKNSSWQIKEIQSIKRNLKNNSKPKIFQSFSNQSWLIFHL